YVSQAAPAQRLCTNCGQARWTHELGAHARDRSAPQCPLPWRKLAKSLRSSQCPCDPNWGVMVSPFQLSTSRRRVLQFLIASRVFSQIGRSARAQDATVPSRLPDPLPWAPRDLGKPIGEPKEALSVFDFEPVMKNNVPAAHFGYTATGLDDEVTLR